MAITSVANMAIKARQIESAVERYRGLGAQVGPIEEWNGVRRCDVVLGDLAVTLFTRAIYESETDDLPDGVLHFACFTDDFDNDVAQHDIFWGPQVVSGGFGVRSIAFTRIDGTTIEFMKQLEAP